MSSREQEQEAVESEDGLRAQREALEADLLELARLIEAEHTEWQAWRRSAELPRRAVTSQGDATDRSPVQARVSCKENNTMPGQGKWMTFDQASRRVGYTVDALHRFVREGRIRTRSGWLSPYSREVLLREDVETIRRTMSGGARDWDSGES